MATTTTPNCPGCAVPMNDRRVLPESWTRSDGFPCPLPTVHLETDGREFVFRGLAGVHKVYLVERGEESLSEPEPALPGIEATLAERGARYGRFAEHAAIAQSFKNVVSGTIGYERMKPDARQAMDVIFDKFARMLNGDPEYDDNWRDIVGYATLVLDRITEDGKQMILAMDGLDKTNPDRI